MSVFIDTLNESAVTYIPDVASYGWHVIPGSGAPRDGWEAISPFGEIRCFDTREAAHSWRMSQVREFVAWRTAAAPTADDNPCCDGTGWTGDRYTTCNDHSEV